MNGFSSAQLRKLMSKLDRAHVQTRSVEGRPLDYIEGWFALNEANAIFGFANWDRETVHFERLFERVRGDMTTCAYLARVRIRVRAGDSQILREGTGCGTASARNSADAHDLAIKAAETDATKRALATFGNRFGLCLYDKEQNGVSRAKVVTFSIHDLSGSTFADNLSPESFCSGLRQMISKMEAASDLVVCYVHNMSQIAKLREAVPTLKSQKGEHYADILERLIIERLSASPLESEAQSPNARIIDWIGAHSTIAPRSPVDKSALTIATERRYRDKAHLRAVASRPCVVCGREPSHAHHLKFAQRRGLAQKVSDEFVVPLCSLHHDELHRTGGELEWWRTKNISPLPIAAELWSQSRQNGQHSPDSSGAGSPDSIALAANAPNEQSESVRQQL